MKQKVLVPTIGRIVIYRRMYAAIVIQLPHYDSYNNYDQLCVDLFIPHEEGRAAYKCNVKYSPEYGWSWPVRSDDVFVEIDEEIQPRSENGGKFCSICSRRIEFKDSDSGVPHADLGRCVVSNGFECRAVAQAVSEYRHENASLSRRIESLLQELAERPQRPGHEGYFKWVS